MKHTSIRRFVKALGRDTAGTTLMEAVCGILILTIIVTAMYSGFLVAQKNLAKGDLREEHGQAAFETLERDEGEAGDEATLQLPLGDVHLTFKGSYSMAGGEEGGATLFSFNTQTVSFADGMRNMYIYWFNRIYPLPLAERKALGYPYGHMNNDLMRAFVRDKEFGGSYPVLSADLLNRYLLPSEIEKEERRADNILINTQYIQPYYNVPSVPTGANPADYYKAELNTVVYASNKTSSNWNTRLIYDHEEGAWYYHSGGNVTFYINNDWSYTKNKIHGADWRKLV